VLNDNV